MLKNLNPLLTPELLYVLRAMGHGDELVLADANFPAYSIAADTVYGDVIRLEGVNIVQAAEAILSVLPLDSFVDAPIQRMEIIGQPTELADGCSGAAGVLHSRPPGLCGCAHQRASALR